MIALLGYGKTTSALAKKIQDAHFFEEIEKSYKDSEGFLHLPFVEYDPARYIQTIVSPGIPPSHPAVRKASNLISEYDYFASAMPFSIWISGTNGKTTTTQMIAHLLGDKAAAGGNIGTPLANLPQKPIWVLETSSFTLHYTNIAKPNIYVLLPITPDHLSWHGGFEAYEAAKLKPLSWLREGEVAIVPKKYANTPSKGRIIGYEGAEDLGKIFGIELVKIGFQGAFLLDAALALTVQKILYNRLDYEAINAFTIEPHKQEKIIDKAGRVWINDSKATNIDATLQLLKNYKNSKIYLILGGDNKGVSLEPLFAHLNNIEIFAIGKAMPHICELAQKYRIPCHASQTLQNAINLIKQKHTKDTIAILSPACASLDQFASYKERGEVFKQEVLS